MSAIGTQGINKTSVAWAFCAVLIALLPHATRFSPWLMLAFFAMGSWRVLGAYGKLPLPDRRYLSIWLLKQGVAIAIFIATYLSFDGQLGRDAGVAMLTALLGLKLLEMRTPRDFYVVMFLAYFLVVTNLFYSQTLMTATYMFTVVLMVTAGLIHFNGRAGGLSKKQCFKLSIQYCLQAVPIMIVAFILFPRIPGPLWGVSQNSTDGVTGLSDEITIGSISRLSISDEIAFRVAFKDREPRARDLYWRGPVLWQTDGVSWRAGTPWTIPKRSPPPPAVGQAGLFDYQIIIEPHGKKWVFALDHIQAVRDSLSVVGDYRVLAPKPIATRQRFELTSDVAHTPRQITPTERTAALNLPLNRHPKTIALASRWRSEIDSNEDLVKHALTFFNQQKFSYTLTPAPLSRDAVDSFLFETREGFCEYYASAFVILMRAAGIPARIVTGYHGGEYNTLSDFMVIRQRDAHAWAEVYLESVGWTRVDPTAAVAPGRISMGLTQVFPARRALSMLESDHPVAFTWHRMREMWEAVNFNWSRWVLGYSPKRQRQFLEQLGLRDWHYGSLIISLTLVGAAVMLLLAWFIFSAKREETDQVSRLYAEFCNNLAKSGLVRAPHEGPMDYARRISVNRQDLAPEIEKITTLYIELRYASRNNDVETFAKYVHDFACR